MGGEHWGFRKKDTEGVRRGGARRVFIYTAGFIAPRVRCVAREPSPPGHGKQHHFKLECPLRRQVSCQKKSSRPRNTNKIHWPFPRQLLCSSESQHREASLSLHRSLCVPADSKRSRPTRLFHHSRVRYRRKGQFPWYATDLWGRKLGFLDHSPWKDVHVEETNKRLHGFSLCGFH